MVSSGLSRLAESDSFGVPWWPPLRKAIHLMARPTKRRPNGFRLPSGAVRIQVLLHPAEYEALIKNAKGRSASAIAREIIAFHFAYPGGPIEWNGRDRYQPRGFARA